MKIKDRQLLQPFVWSMTSRLNMIRWAWDAENENASFIKLFLSRKWSFRLGFREHILPVWNVLGMKSLFFVFYDVLSLSVDELCQTVLMGETIRSKSKTRTM